MFRKNVYHQIWCNGSAPFSYCVQFWNGNYTVTGNESCISKKMFLSTCNFQITHYFGNSTNYTVVIIVENDVQKLVRSVNVNVYEGMYIYTNIPPNKKKPYIIFMVILSIRI